MNDTAASPHVSLGSRLRRLQPGALPSGIYAWLATVGLPLFREGASLPCRIVAGIAPAFLVAGFVVLRRWPPLGRLLGIWGFVGSSVLAWVLGGKLLDVAVLDPARSALGAVGWAMFAFGWGNLRRADVVPEDDPHAVLGRRLSPRGKLVGFPFLVFLLASGLAVAPVFAAWAVVRSHHALLAHAVAVACAVAMIGAGAEVAVGRGQWVAYRSQRARLNLATGSLITASLLLAVGAAFSLY